ncbi:V4R domain protein [uncultured archaeon]|nr:V4R domain protein [uncultured archaeon]
MAAVKTKLKANANCKLCEFKIPDPNYIYCPQCGNKLSSDGIYPPIKLNYLWEKEHGGKIIYENFKAVRDFGLPANEEIHIRRTLGNTAHPYLMEIRRFSTLFICPHMTTELYKIGKLMGYFSSEIAFKTTNLEPAIQSLRNSGIFWTVFENKRIQDTYCGIWRSQGYGDIHLTKVDRKNRTVQYSVKYITPIVHSNRPLCDVELGTLCGSAEVMFSGFWCGNETECQHSGNKTCKFNLHLSEKNVDSELPTMESDEYSPILDNVLERIITNEENRLNHKEYFHISADQCLNYMLSSPSPGHYVLSKHAGVITGKRIAKEADLIELSIKERLDYLRNLFTYLKAGIISKVEERSPERILIHMDESVYASGVNNIDLKLCVFLAGIIEGVINEGSKTRWEVTEKDCLASGNDDCVFLAKQRTLGY